MVVFSVIVVLEFVVIVPCHIHLTSEDRLHIRMFTCEFHEFLDTVHVSMVGDGQGRHTKFISPVKEFGN